MATLFLAMAGVAQAQLTDPTKPPPALSAAATDPSGATVPVASGLQSVILRKGGKPAALIDGNVVELGGRVGEAKLIRISEDAVVLKGPQGDETLRLMPAAEKKTKVGVTEGNPLFGTGGTAQKAAQNRNKETDK